MSITSGSNVFDEFERVRFCHRLQYDDTSPIHQKYLSKCCYSLLQVVLGNRDISVISDLEDYRNYFPGSHFSDVEKIKFLVNCIHSFYKLDFARAYPSIVRFTCRSSCLCDNPDDPLPPLINFTELEKDTEHYFVKQLIGIILNGNSIEKPRNSLKDRRFLALKTLEFLGRFDQRADQIFRQCSKFIVTHDQRVKKGLESWRINSGLLVLEKGLESYSAGTISRNFIPNFEQKEWKTRKIYLGSDSDAFVDNLTEVGIKEGFTVETPLLFNRSKERVWLRDLFVITPSGKILVPKRIQFDGAFRDVHNAFYLVNPWEWSMGQVAESQPSLDRLIENGGQEASFYFEGGNLSLARNRAGQLFFLSGQGNLQMNFIYDAVDIISESLRNYPQIVKGLSEQEYKDIAEEEKAWMRPALIRSGIMHQMEDMASKRRIGFAAVLAQRQLKAKITNELQMPTLFLGFPYEMQAEFHIDMFIIPAPNGMIFIQDYSQTVTILEQILAEENLNFLQEQILDEYLAKAKWMASKYQTQILHIAAQLEQSLFTVHFVPGIYHLNKIPGDEGSSTTKSAYINCIFGLNAKNEIYCISIGSMHPFETSLKRKFVESLQANGIDHIYFLGRPAFSEVKFGGAFAYSFASEKLVTEGGVHCMSQELRELFPDDVDARLKHLLTALNQLDDSNEDQSDGLSINSDEYNGTISVGFSTDDETSSDSFSSDEEVRFIEDGFARGMGLKE